MKLIRSLLFFSTLVHSKKKNTIILCSLTSIFFAPRLSIIDVVDIIVLPWKRWKKNIQSQSITTPFFGDTSLKKETKDTKHCFFFSEKAGILIMRVSFYLKKKNLFFPKRSFGEAGKNIKRSSTRCDHFATFEIVTTWQKWVNNK